MYDILYLPVFHRHTDGTAKLVMVRTKQLQLFPYVIFTDFKTTKYFGTAPLRLILLSKQAMTP